MGGFISSVGGSDGAPLGGLVAVIGAGDVASLDGFVGSVSLAVSRAVAVSTSWPQHGPNVGNSWGCSMAAVVAVRSRW